MRRADLRVCILVVCVLMWERTAAEAVPLASADCADLCTPLAVPLVVRPGDPKMSGFQGLHDVVQGARVIALAERTHLPEFRALRNQVFRYLVENEAVTAIAVETPFTLAVMVDDYVLGRSELSEDIVRSVFLGGTPFAENRELVEWMRAYNDLPSTRRKLRFYGVDLGGRAAPGQSLFHFGRDAVDAALRYVQKVDVVHGRRLAERLQPLLPRFNRENYAALSSAERDRITVAIADLLGLFQRQHVRWIARTSAEEYARASQSAVVARHLDQNLRAKRWEEPHLLDDWEGNERDAGMLDNVRWALEREGRHGKLLLFAANSHLTRTASAGSFTSLGEHLRETLGEDYVAIGTFRDFTWDEPQPGRMQNLARIRINQVVWNVIDRVGLPLFFVDLRRLPGRQWFAGDDWQPTDAFDAMIFIDTRQPLAAAAVKFGEWGVDLAARDPQVKPGDDFFRHVNGRWLATTQIPADRSSWGTFDELAEEAEVKVRDLLEALPRNAPAGSVEQKAGDYYRAFLDTDAIERAGLVPAGPGLQAIARARSHDDIGQLLGQPELQLKSPIVIGIAIDAKNPDRYSVELRHGGLGLPEREYYLQDDATLAGIRVAYRAYIARMLALAGETDVDAARHAGEIFALETKIARQHWPVARTRERELTYNSRTRRQLDELAPQFPWQQVLGAAGLDRRREFIVAQPDAVAGLARLFRLTPVSVWRSYLKFHYLDGWADVLPDTFAAAAFDFRGRTLNGQPQQRERWKRAVRAVNRALGETVGQLYVARHFSPQSKAQAAALVENLRLAYMARIRRLSWMSESTKQAALGKLATLRPKIAYPDRWRDYSALSVRAGDAFGNQQRAALFEQQRALMRLDQPTDRDEWRMPPQTVNAYYDATFNEIVFPAAILQPPFFAATADPAVNYGGIGAVIGHEMGHGFDDQGAKSDANGILRAWWQPADEAAFKRLAGGLVRQYERYQPLPGLSLDGQLTLGENIGDLGGLVVAHEAYQLSLQRRTAPVLDGLSGDQRFFLSWAQIWRTQLRDAWLRKLVMGDSHSPPQYRVNGVVRNVDAWYAAFDIQPGDPLYLPPDQRVRLW